MRWLRHKAGKVLHALLRIWFCMHDQVIRRRAPVPEGCKQQGEMRLVCWVCGKDLGAAGFGRSQLAKQLDRQQRRASKKRDKREAKPVLVSRRVA